MYSPAAGELAMDRVAVVGNARVAKTVEGHKATVEVAIPLKSIGLKLQKDLKLKMDWGMLVSTDGRTVQRRAYWANRSATGTGDIVAEGRFMPHAWGQIEFRRDRNERRTMMSKTQRVPIGGVEISKHGFFKPYMDKTITYLLAHSNADDMLYRFRLSAGISNPPGKLFGWENIFPAYAGMFMMGAGNILQWQEEPELRKRLNLLIAGLKECINQNNALNVPVGTEDCHSYPLTRISQIEGEFFSCAIEFTRTECPYSRISAPIAGRGQWVKHCGSGLSVV
ncbi:MAG: hypothetical protein WBD63_03235 [Phycisphaerae bacterium]